MRLEILDAIALYCTLWRHCNVESGGVHEEVTTCERFPHSGHRWIDIRVWIWIMTLQSQWRIKRKFDHQWRRCPGYLQKYTIYTVDGSGSSAGDERVAAWKRQATPLGRPASGRRSSPIWFWVKITVFSCPPSADVAGTSMVLPVASEMSGMRQGYPQCLWWSGTWSWRGRSPSLLKWLPI